MNKNLNFNETVCSVQMLIVSHADKKLEFFSEAFGIFKKDCIFATLLKKATANKNLKYEV